MYKINIYLNFDGNTLEAFKFYQSIFGGEFEMLQLMKDSPVDPNLPAEDSDKVMHIALTLGKSVTIHGTDTIASMGHQLVKGNNFHLMLEPDTREETDRYFKALAAGGSSIQAMREEFWGAYYGSLTDKFGIHWMLNCDEKK